MTKNIGTLDRLARIVIGLGLIAFALKVGFPDTGWNALGWIGLVPLVTAIFAYCPAYSVIGLRTGP